jgi:hypothetical protein
LTRIAGYPWRSDVEVSRAHGKAFPLERIAGAQREFLEKKHFGNFVLIPPRLDDSDANL